MRWFLNLSTRTKLFLGFAQIVIVLAITMLISYRSVTAIRDAQQTLMDRDFTVALELTELMSHLNRQRSQLLEMLITPDRSKQGALRLAIQDRTKQVDALLRGIADRDGTEAGPLKELRNALGEYRRTRDEELALIADGKPDDAQSLATGVEEERFEKVRAIAAELADEARQRARASVQESERRTNETVRAFQILAGVVLLLAPTLVLLLGRIIAKPLVEISRVAERIAAGDLTVSLAPNERRDEVGVLSRTIRLMVENLRVVTKDIADASGMLGASASQIVASSTQLAAGSAQTATALGETTTTVEEVRQTAQVATQKAKYVSDNAQNVAAIAQTGRKSTEETGAGMNRIREQMDSIAQSMVRLSEQTQAIGQIITTVDDLAQQSNLLAVNASIEAAKAGEQGKGFTVVAQEVKSLAEQSKAATTQVRTILNDIQKATGAAVMATEQGSKAVESGARQSQQAGESIVALAGSVAEAAQAATQIAASSQQQLVGMDQVALAMESVKQASTQNVDSAKQLEEAARNLDGLGRRLRELVEKFEV